MKILFNIDTEADFWKYIPGPWGWKSLKYRMKWNLNKIRGKFIYAKDRQGLINIVNFCKEKNIPATFNIVGHLYLKSCNGFPHFKEKKPKSIWFKEDWYYWDKPSNYKEKPGLYLGDYIEKKMKTPLFDLGIHNFSHEALTLETQEIADSVINAAVLSAKSIGIKPISYCAPFNMNEDIKNPDILFNSLKKNKIRVIRYLGKEDYPKKQYYQHKFAKPEKKKGIICIWDTSYFDGTSSKEHIINILKDIKIKLEEEKKGMHKGKIYTINCHDFTFKTNENLEKIFLTLLSWREKGERIEFIKMSDLV
jgi:peptidoglycan/xylan/chitin deacetylase (PgdA/CDA1 family)